jgi:diacylglycerol kinase family enzyme
MSTPDSDAPAAIVLNEAAGSADTERVRRTVELVRSRLGADQLLVATRDPAELEAWLRERIGPYQRLVVAGGDGTLGVAFNVAAERPDMVLGFVPAGFGNATAHLLRLPREPEALADLIVGADARPIDLVEVDGRLSLFVGAGWDARVAQRYAAGGARRAIGWVQAVVASVPALWRQMHLEVRADGWRVHRGPAELLVVSTTPFYGRGLVVNPGARPDAGRLVLRVYPASVPALAAETARWISRARPKSRPIVARRVELESTDERPILVQGDGDVLGERHRWQVELRPKAVRLIGRWG